MDKHLLYLLKLLKPLADSCSYRSENIRVCCVGLQLRAQRRNAVCSQGDFRLFVIGFFPLTAFKNGKQGLKPNMELAVGGEAPAEARRSCFWHRATVSHLYVGLTAGQLIMHWHNLTGTELWAPSTQEAKGEEHLSSTRTATITALYWHPVAKVGSSALFKCKFCGLF